ncbi:MAG: hypothetical protein M1840_009012 [Geoglossum simile]|nr:MAG: hypothetical protein M1840_009012 [Geoglossum simile]
MPSSINSQERKWRETRLAGLSGRFNNPPSPPRKQIPINPQTQHQPVTDDHVFTYAFSRHFNTLTPWSDALVSSTADHPPSRYDPSSVHKHGTIISDLTHLKKSKFKRKWRKWRPYYVAEYELVMSLKGGDLGFALAWGGRTWGERVDVEFL